MYLFNNPFLIYVLRRDDIHVISREVKALPLIIRLTRGGRLISAINCDNWLVRPPRPQSQIVSLNGV